MRRVVILLVAALGVCGVAGAGGFASARSSVASVVVLGSAAYPAYPDVVADGSLGFDAVWTDGDQAIETAHRSAVSGHWTRPVVLSRDVGQAAAQIAGSGSGAAAAIWYISPESESPNVVQASYRASLSGAWRPAVVLTRSGADASSLQVAFDGQGDAFAAWIDGRGVVMSEHPAGASVWSPAVIVEADRGAGSFLSRDLTLAVSPAGTIALAWEHYLSGTPECCTSAGTRNDLWLAIRPAGRSIWLPRLSLGLDGIESGQNLVDPYVYGPQLAINAHGTVFVASQSPNAGGYRGRVAVISPTDRWRKPQFVQLPASPSAPEPAIAAGPDGDSTVVWISGSVGGVSAADLSPAGHILDVRRLSSFGDTPELAENGKGDLAGAWGEAAYRPAGHGWCPAVPVRAADEGYSVAIAPDDVAEVIWDYELGAHGVVDSRTLTSCRR